MQSGRIGRRPGSGDPAGSAYYRWVQVADVRIGSLVAGSGSPVVLLHGLAGSQRWWRRTIAGLASRFEVHVPELFALRRQSRRVRPPPVRELASLVAEWLRTLRDEPVALVGHSMGGQLSLHIGAQYPEVIRRLVLVNSTGIPRGFRPAELVRLCRGLLPPGAWGAPAFLPTIGLDSVRAGAIALGTSLRSLLGDDVRPLLPRIEVPTAVVWGELDPFVPLYLGVQLARNIPDATLHVIAGAAHNPMIDRPETFNRILLELLTKSA
jgi:pimeloyl-ACP methyl ester carboxylesterase